MLRNRAVCDAIVLEIHGLTPQNPRASSAMNGAQQATIQSHAFEPPFFFPSVV